MGSNQCASTRGRFDRDAMFSSLEKKLDGSTEITQDQPSEVVVSDGVVIEEQTAAAQPAAIARIRSAQVDQMHRYPDW
jgi:hypothetical protein